MDQNCLGDPSRGQPQGLTLVELLIVLLIVGLGWFTLLPRLDPAVPSGKNAPLHELNHFLHQVRDMAIQTGRFQEVRLDSLSGELTWNNLNHRLPHPPSRCILNGSSCPYPHGHFRIYPQGHMDWLRFSFSGGEIWVTVDLDARMAPGVGP